MAPSSVPWLPQEPLCERPAARLGEGGPRLRLWPDNVLFSASIVSAGTSAATVRRARDRDRERVLGSRQSDNRAFELLIGGVRFVVKADDGRRSQGPNGVRSHACRRSYQRGAQ